MQCALSQQFKLRIADGVRYETEFSPVTLFSQINDKSLYFIFPKLEDENPRLVKGVYPRNKEKEIVYYFKYKNKKERKVSYNFEHLPDLHIVSKLPSNFPQLNTWIIPQSLVDEFRIYQIDTLSIGIRKQLFEFLKIAHDISLFVPNEKGLIVPCYDLFE